MRVILHSFVLSFGVFGRMILPVLAITLASAIVFSPLNTLTGGYVQILSGPITATFISLFGIRAALSLMGELSRPSYAMLAFFAVVYGVLLVIATGAALGLAEIAALAYAGWQLGDAAPISAFMQAEKTLQFAFALHSLSAKAILSLALYTAVYALMAVPMASAARSAGTGARSSSFFNGFGRKFLPLFLVFALSFFAQYFFNLLTFFFAIIPLFLSLLSIAITQTLPNLDMAIVAKGLAASAGLLWLQSWIWAASAVALVASEKGAAHPQEDTPGAPDAAPDVRSLRKSRETRFS